MSQGPNAFDRFIKTVPPKSLSSNIFVQRFVGDNKACVRKRFLYPHKHGDN